MADELIKISELEPSTDIYDGCCIPIVTNNETKKLTYALLKQKLQNDLDIPEEVVPEFVLDVNGHLLAIFEGEAPIDLGRVKGDAGHFNSVTASVDNNTGTPSVAVTVSGDDINFAFHNLKQDISGKEDKTNKVTSLSASSTDVQYPSAKCVYDLVGNIESLLAALL